MMIEAKAREWRTKTMQAPARALACSRSHEREGEEHRGSRGEKERTPALVRGRRRRQAALRRRRGGRFLPPKSKLSTPR